MHNFLTPLKRRPPSPHHHQPTSFKCHKSSRSFWWCCAHRFFGCGSSGEGVKWPCSRHKPFSRLHCLWGRSTTAYEGLKKVYLLKISKEETESPLFKPPPASSNHHKVIKPDWPLSLEPFSKPLQICIGMHLRLKWCTIVDPYSPLLPSPIREATKRGPWKSEESPTPTHTQHSSWADSPTNHMDATDALPAALSWSWGELRGKNMRNKGLRVINARDRHQRNSIFWFMMLYGFLWGGSWSEWTDGRGKVKNGQKLVDDDIADRRGDTINSLEPEWFRPSLPKMVKTPWRDLCTK